MTLTREDYEILRRHEYAPGTPLEPAAEGYWYMDWEDGIGTVLVTSGLTKPLDRGVCSVASYSDTVASDGGHRAHSSSSHGPSHAHGLRVGDARRRESRGCDAA